MPPFGISMPMPRGGGGAKGPAPAAGRDPLSMPRGSRQAPQAGLPAQRTGGPQAPQAGFAGAKGPPPPAGVNMARPTPMAGGAFGMRSAPASGMTKAPISTGQASPFAGPRAFREFGRGGR